MKRPSVYKIDNSTDRSLYKRKPDQRILMITMKTDFHFSLSPGKEYYGCYVRKSVYKAGAEFHMLFSVYQLHVVKQSYISNFDVLGFVKRLCTASTNFSSKHLYLNVRMQF